MIQRVQTLYLVVVVLISALAAFLTPVWRETQSAIALPYNYTYLQFGYLLIAALGLIVVFLFKNRKRQVRLVQLLIILNLVLLGFFVYWFLNLPGENTLSEKGIEMLIPIISIVFLVLARRGIKKDEALVKSVDRLR